MLATHLRPGASVLELGAGTGFQARELERRGFRVTAIDVPQSNYSDERVYPVIDYDGQHFPVRDHSIDVVSSSNVLEHVRDLAQIHRETRRVLRPEGYCVHAMPTGAWRFWTNLSGYADLLPSLLKGIPELRPRGIGPGEARRLAEATIRLARTIGGRILPQRHGETGNAVTELWTFGRRHWIEHFRAHGFEVMAVEPMGLFYTGHMVLGRRWSLAGRRRAARWLGCACVLYKVRPLSTSSARP